MGHVTADLRLKACPAKTLLTFYAVYLAITGADCAALKQLKAMFYQPIKRTIIVGVKISRVFLIF
jgi:hypothetical protein